MATKQRELHREAMREPERMDHFDRSATLDTFGDLSVKSDNTHILDRMDIDDNAVGDSDDRDGDTNSREIPSWLLSMRPIRWNSTNVCQKNNVRGRNCCLFYPLNYCKGLDVVNGFCMFHLKAIFNLVYQADSIYQIDERGKAVVLRRSQCFVAEPQEMNDRITAVFPIFEMFEHEPRMEDIKLYNLAKYLRAIGMQNWERVYSVHVNFLHGLITLRTHVPQNQQDQILNSQLLLHWNVWNEYHSWLISRYPAKLQLFYSSDGDNVRVFPTNNFTAITQMILRLFTLPYTSLDQKKYYSTIPNYGMYVRNHLAYVDNLCSSGTISTESGLHCIGNLASLSIIRTDKNTRSLLHYTMEQKCNEDFCVNAKVNLNAPTLNKMTVVSTENVTPVKSLER